MLTHPPFTHDQILNIRAIHAWFNNFNTYYPYPNLKTQAENFAHIIRHNSLHQHKIEYRYIDCSYFMWLCIFHFKPEAAAALRFNMNKVERYLKKTYNIHVESQYPLAIHFALLSRNTDFWDSKMHKYFEPVSMDNLTPGTIVSWAFDSFLNPRNKKFQLEVDTGHVACVTSLPNKKREIQMCHSVPKKLDPKKQGGPTETSFTLDGYIMKNIKNEKTPGGAFRLKNTI